MTVLSKYNKVTSEDQKLAEKSYASIKFLLEKLESDHTEIKIDIEGSKEKIIISRRTLESFGEVLKTMSEGKSFSIIADSTEVSTQMAADILGCSRPHVVKLLEEGKMEYTRVGKHRRIKYEDVINYKNQMKADREKRLIQMMHDDEEMGLYDP